MADLSITAGNVIGSGVKETLIAGGTLTAGMPVRKDASGQAVAASDSSAANAAVYGIALNGASDGQPVEVIKSGNIDLGATLAVGKVYVLSTSGGIAPVDDVGSGEFITVIGVASAADNLVIGIVVGGVAAADAVT